MSDTLLELAFQHHRAGAFEAAQQLYHQIVTERPAEAAAWHGWGLLSAQQNQPALAVVRLEQALRLAPNQPSYWHTLGRVHAQQNDQAAAAAAYRQAVTLDPGAGAIWSRLTAALRQTGQTDDAVAAGQQAVRLLPDDPIAHNHLGNALCDAGRDDAAADQFRIALRLEPDFVEACTNLGSTLTRLREYDDAIRWCDQAVALSPTLPEAHNNRAVALAAVGRFDEAIDACRRAVALRPDYAAAFSNLGVNLCNAGYDADDAVAACATAVALQPADPLLRTVHGMILLTVGRFDTGWAEHDHRLLANPRIAGPTFAEPRWTGEPLPTGTILLHAEQGFGDTIQFVRFVPAVAALVGHVVLEVQPELVELLAPSQPPNVTTVARGTPLPCFDVHCPLMSLPVPLGIHDPALLPREPYLHADANRVQHWRDRLGPGRHLGLVWAGRPTHTNDRQRSASLVDLAPLASVPDVIFHSLQKGPAALEALSPPHDLRLEAHGPLLHTWSETAALLAALDGVIAVDTAVAHLAGALGKPVWLLLPFVADWRWMRQRVDSPWYPSVRIYRQQTWAQWSAPVQQLATELRQF